nr:ScyD/ScyE family protein [Microbacterium bovistercoris]
MRIHRIRVVAAVGSASLLMLGLAAAPASAHTTSTSPSSGSYRVIAEGLNNPRGITVDARGALYVAEAGTGGPESDSCFVASAGTRVCAGDTSSITQLTASRHGWHQQRVVTGLPSLAPPPGATGAGTEASGASAVLVNGRHYEAVIGFGVGCEDVASGPDPSCNPWTEHGLSRLSGALVTGTIGSHHAPRVVTSLAEYEYRTNPIDSPDSNPVSLVRDRGGYLIADAGANVILQVRSRNHIRALAQFPDVDVQNPFAPPGVMTPMQFVPTSAVRGPDGALYVSQLTGFPFPQGGSTIWRISAGHAPTPYATGLTNVTDLAFARDGSLYAVEISAAGLLSGDTTGALMRVPRHGGTATVVAGGLPAPYGVALQGRDAYVTVNSSSPGIGQVVQVSLTR